MASRDYTLAGDLIQDTFLKLWSARGRYGGIGKSVTFLFSIAKNHGSSGSGERSGRAVVGEWGGGGEEREEERGGGGVRGGSGGRDLRPGEG